MLECPQLTQAMHRFVQELALQSQQVAACNRRHEVEERLFQEVTNSAAR